LSRVLVLTGGILLVIGLTAELFELHSLQIIGLGWQCIISGSFLVAIGYLMQRRRLTESPSAEYLVEVSQPPKRQPADSSPKQVVSSVNPVHAGQGPKPVSFVAHVAPAEAPENPKPEVISKTLTPEILNIRYAAYRCEISTESLRVIYQNTTQRELKWYEISSIVIRQMPYQAPWEGKLILDILPNVVAKEKIHPIRILSSTYVNYGFLPQGQSASTKENIRRLASHILTQNRSVYVDPGTDYFVHAGQPPVRFLSMSQFTEYDSRYS
jgi:hypothetical protein